MAKVKIAQLTTIREGKPIWTQLEEETDRAYDMFKRYRSLGRRRTLRVVASLSRVSVGYVQELNKKYHWKARVRSYDVLQDEKDEQELDRVRRLRAKKVASSMELGYDVLLKGLQRLVEDDEAEINLGDVSKALSVLGKEFHLIHGESTDNLQVQLQQARESLKGKSAEELKQLYERIKSGDVGNDEASEAILDV